MLSLTHPSILQLLKGFDYGLCPVFDPEKGQYILIVKATKEAILTSRVKNEFNIYLIEDTLGSKSHVGLITAFFDDHDEPIVIKTPLFADDEMLEDISHVLSQKEFEIYFFDEHNRELLGASASNRDFARFGAEIGEATFCNYSHAEALDTIKRLEHGFAIRTTDDDDQAYTIKLGTRLYPDDFVLIDARQESNSFNDAQETIATTTLVRSGEPGPMQERDIATMMSRVFAGDSIYLNPFREDSDTELTDILIVADEVMLFVQAKDSPNTKEILARPIERKRKTIQSHINKASRQLRGALTYARDNKGISIKDKSGVVHIPVADRTLVGLVIVREMFDDEYLECSAPVLKIVHSLALPAILLDYSGLHIMTQHFHDPIVFINGLFDMLGVALEKNQFPKPAWSGAPPL